MQIDNYTGLPIGTPVDKGTVEKCPHCGRNGLAEVVNGKTFYTHFQWVGFNKQGQPEVGWDMCPKMTVSVKASPPE